MHFSTVFLTILTNSLSLKLYRKFSLTAIILIKDITTSFLNESKLKAIVDSKPSTPGDFYNTWRFCLSLIYKTVYNTIEKRFYRYGP